MLKERVLEFIKKEFLDLEDFIYEVEIKDEYLYLRFFEVLSKSRECELMFKIIAEDLYLHSTTYGWKNLDKGNSNRYFWIELLGNNQR